jgi:hypothetical protein
MTYRADESGYTPGSVTGCSVTCGGLRLVPPVTH